MRNLKVHTLRGPVLRAWRAKKVQAWTAECPAGSGRTTYLRKSLTDAEVIAILEAHAVKHYFGVSAIEHFDETPDGVRPVAVKVNP